jgi:hypothetical protein
MFLQGPWKQQLEKLTGGIHDEYHRRLNAALARLNLPGVPARGGGPGGSKQDWEAAFQQYPQLWALVKDAMRDASSSIDRQFGTALRDALEIELNKARR